ncbi:DUF3021 domain-containing protein [Fructobacillus ficulneus]|uniref:DUF3021 domain-containing protein n=1 Tax=Fructobacillus ficulneus TaxID=157463 RepID=UPI00078541FE|nr:DUF3021 domain-containing protein [Fructobacillus ficulneus]
MTKKIRILIVGAGIGVNIGLFSSLIFSYVFQSTTLQPSTPNFVNHFHNPISAFTWSIILWALMGTLFAGSSLIFQNDRLSITKQTTYHFLLTYTGYTALALLAGWFPINSTWLFTYSIIYLFIYFWIWYISMRQAKKLAQDLNQSLQNPTNPHHS